MQVLRNLAASTLMALGLSFSLHAQCYEPLIGTSIGTGDDIVLASQAIGFAFPFAGTTYTNVHPSTNGFVYLSNAGVPAPGGALCCTGTTAQLVLGSPKICAYWSDLNMISGTGSVFFNALPGKAVITWQDAVEFGVASPAPRFSFQMQLLASGEIVFAYDGRCVIATAGDYLVGASEGGGAAVPATSDFSVPGITAATTCFELFNNVGLNFDLISQTLQLIPAGPVFAFVSSQCAGGNTAYGTGCYSEFASFYESFASAAAFDLANTSMTMLNTGTGYVMTPGLTTYVAPTGAATSLVLTDDSETVVTLGSAFAYPGGSTTTLNVCSNGFVSVGSNGTTFTPAVAGFLNAANPSWRSWHDFNPAIAGSGQVKFEQVGAIAYITWDGVYSYATTNPETMQMQFDTSSGSVHMVWGTIGGAGNAYLVGWSPGGPSADPGNRDISATLPGTFSVFGADLLPLRLAAAPSPVSTPTTGGTVTYTTSNMPPFAPGLYVGVNILSLGQILPPGFDLGFLGAPGCPALITTLDLLQSMIGISDTQTVSLTFPAGLPIGTTIFSQSAALFPPFSLPNGQNAFGLVTSNGVKQVTGAW